jgi:hypothetical protein
MGKAILKITLLLAAMAMIAAGVSFLFPGTPPPTPRPLPNPNGYDVFLSAGKLLPKSGVAWDKVDQPHLATYVAANSNALELARTGLALETRVPLTRDFITNRAGVLPALRVLGQTFAAEARLAELDSQTNRAVEIYLDALRLGYSVRSGGLIVDAMIGTAISSLGTDSLKRLCNQLDAETCRHAAATMESCEAASDSWADISARDLNWMLHLSRGIQNRLYATLFAGRLKASLTKSENRFNEQSLKTRHLLLQLAARAYELEKGAKPTNVSELVPDYLKAVPADPVTHSKLTFRP